VIKKTYDFCLFILSLPVGRAKALANLVMALSSHASISVVGLSKSPLFHFQYSSISAAVKHLARTETGRKTVERFVIHWCLKHHWQKLGRIILSTDKTHLCKPHSPTLKDRTLVAVPNCVVKGNKPLDVGFEYSFVNVLADVFKSWSLPIMIDPIQKDQTANQVAGTQITSLMEDEELPFIHGSLIVNNLDRGYGAVYLKSATKFKNLVSILNLRQSSKVYAQAKGKGKQIYDQRYYLVGSSCDRDFKKHPKTKQPYTVYLNSICERPHDDLLAYKTALKNGRKVIVILRRYNDLLWRAKQGVKMADKPFDVVCAKVLDAKTLKPVWKGPLFLSAVGEKRRELSVREIYETYLTRYDIEPQFRFAKQKVLLEAFQTCIVQHLNNWMTIVMMALWLLFTARNIVSNQPEKWQQYTERKKDELFPNETHTLSMSQVRKSIQGLLLTFDKKPFLPRKSKPGPGRKKGQSQKTREKFHYVKKTAAKARNP
jgi:hypothetical protein